MRNLLVALVLVGLLAVPSLASLDVQVLATPASILVGGTSTIQVQIRENTSTKGVAQVGGEVDATQNGANPLGGLSATLPSPITNFWPTQLQSPPVPIQNPAGVAANGGVQQFGSSQPTAVDTTWGRQQFVTVATYTVTGVIAGQVLLTFNPTNPGKTTGGFYVAGTGIPIDATIGTNTGAVVDVLVPEPATMLLLAIGGMVVARRRR